MLDQRPMIDLLRLHRYFGTTRAVDDVSFHVMAGEVFGFIGPNGAGKTTTMRILATLDLPSYGDALVDGFSVVNDPDRVRRRIGFMPDYFGTYFNVSCNEYLDFFARAYGLRQQRRHEAVRRVMQFTGLDVLADKPIRGFSKGMKQRLCLGRAMIHDPAVLVLDEPAAGLDPRARIELRQMIRQLAERGKAILVSSHILTELAEMCDRVGIIEQGKLLATGTVDEIRREAAPAREMDVRLTVPAEPCHQWLLQQPNVRDVALQGKQLRFTLDGDEEDQVVLLRSLIEQGYPVAEFRGQTKSLEDVFMHVTRGVVQ